MMCAPVSFSPEMIGMMIAADDDAISTAYRAECPLLPRIEMGHASAVATGDQFSDDHRDTQACGQSEQRAGETNRTQQGQGLEVHPFNVLDMAERQKLGTPVGVPSFSYGSHRTSGWLRRALAQAQAPGQRYPAKARTPRPLAGEPVRCRR
jgi:hypothetical protein